MTHSCKNCMSGFWMCCLDVHIISQYMFFKHSASTYTRGQRGENICTQ